MLKVVSVLLGALALANGGTTRSARSGEFNRYYLYTSSLMAVEVYADTENANIVSSRTTVVIVHGHGASYLTSLNPDLVRILLASNSELNVIVVDWSVYAGMSYTLAESAAPSVGLHLRNFLAFHEIPVENTHLVGFNLGAHVVGMTGRLRPGIARITALDPSSSTNRLVRTDANYVEVIHTDADGTILANGLDTQMGDADFYPNGGRLQPGCLSNRQCSHDRSWLFFAASISETTFNAHCCDTIQQKNLNQCGGATIPMGMNTLNHKMPCATGIYRVNTGSSYPF